jgi:hypothetical protein
MKLKHAGTQNKYNIDSMLIKVEHFGLYIHEEIKSRLNSGKAGGGGHPAFNPMRIGGSFPVGKAAGE